MPASFNPVSLGPARIQTAPQSLRDNTLSTSSPLLAAADRLQLSSRAQAQLPGQRVPYGQPTGGISVPDSPEAHGGVAQVKDTLLQNAGTALLAQANSLPNGVLSLLRG